MPVVINDFEVVVPPERPEDRRSGQTGSQQSGVQPLTPAQLQDLLRRQAERLARLRAL